MIPRAGWCGDWCGGVNFSWRLLKVVWKLEREKSKRRDHGGKGAGGEIVWDFLTKLHSNYFRAVQLKSPMPRNIAVFLFPLLLFA